MNKQTRKPTTKAVTTADLRALNERVTELRRKMPDDEPCTILTRLHENGEFLWADEAHVEDALLRLEWGVRHVDSIGRIAKWFDDAIESGFDLKDAVTMAMGALEVVTDRDIVKRLADQLDAESKDRANTSA